MINDSPFDPINFRILQYLGLTCDVIPYVVQRVIVSLPFNPSLGFRLRNGAVALIEGWISKYHRITAYPGARI